jgi:hypothetical protein
LLAVHPIILTYINFQSPSGQDLLVLGQPWSRSWHVGYDEEGTYSDEDLFQSFISLSRALLLLEQAVLTVSDPSMINNHFQAARPRAPLRPLVMPAEINPENAPESSDPEYRRAVRLTSSFLVYHEDKR